MAEIKAGTLIVAIYAVAVQSSATAPEELEVLADWLGVAGDLEVAYNKLALARFNLPPEVKKVDVSKLSGHVVEPKKYRQTNYAFVLII